MNLLIVLFLLTLISILGYMFIETLGLLTKEKFLIKLGYSFGIGVGLVTYQLFIYSRLDLQFTPVNLLIPISVFFLFFVYKSYKNHKKLNIRVPKLGRIELLLLVLILCAFLYTAFEAVIRPPVAWDSWSTWLVQSKIYFLDGKINPNLFSLLRFDYPLTFPLLNTWIYSILGRADDFNILFVSSTFLLFLVLLFFSILKKRTNTLYALIFTFLLISIQNFIRHGGRLEAGLSDLPVGYFAFASLTLLIEYIKNGGKKLLFLLCLFLSITAVIKFEGTLIAGIMSMFLAVSIIKSKNKKNLIFLLIIILPFLDWQVFRKINNVSDSYYSGQYGHHLMVSTQKTLNAILGTIKEFLNIKSWNFLWIGYFYSLLFIKYSKTKELQILNIIVLAQISTYVLIYVFTYGNNPESSIERLLIHVGTIALFSISILFYPIYKKLKIAS